MSAVLWLASCENVRENDIDLPGVPNARQLGGYVIGDKKVRADVLLRSGSLAKASDEAIEALRDRYKLDLSPEEKQILKDKFLEDI